MSEKIFVIINGYEIEATVVEQLSHDLKKGNEEKNDKIQKNLKVRLNYILNSLSSILTGKRYFGILCILAVVSAISTYFYLANFQTEGNRNVLDFILISYSILLALLMAISVVTLVYSFIRRNLTINNLFIIWVAVFVFYFSFNVNTNILGDYLSAADELDYYINHIKNEESIKLYQENAGVFYKSREHKYFESSLKFTTYVSSNQIKNEYKKLTNEISETEDYSSKIRTLIVTSISNVSLAISDDFLNAVNVIFTANNGNMVPANPGIVIMNAVFIIYSQIILIFGVALAIKNSNFT